MRRNLSRVLKQKRTALKHLFAGDSRVLGVFLLGSQADGTATPRSDIDLAVLFDRELDLREELAFAVAVSNELGTDDIDVVNLNRANLLLRFRAIAGKLLYARDEVRVADFVEDTLIAYRDFEPRAQMALRDYLVTLEERTMDLDVKRIEAKLQFIQNNLDLLREMSAFSEADFVADRVRFYAAVHGLEVSIEAMLDVFTPIIARWHLGVPTNDRETLEVALDQKLTSQEHFPKYFQMNKFRNKVVHGYMDVDAKQVYTMLHQDLGDFQLFLDDIRKVIEKEAAKEKNGKKKTNNRN